MKTYEEYLHEARQLLEEAFETRDIGTALRLVELLHDQCLLEPEAWRERS